MNCKKCNQSIVPIGNKRKNGTIQIDWNNRKYHKKCWKTIKESFFFDFIDKFQNTV